jgi:hypothetical protein
MARRFHVWSIAATVLAPLLGATAAHAAGPRVVGGTLPLAKPGGERTAVVARGRAAAVALLPGRPVIAAVGKPGARHAAGRIRVVQLTAGEIATTSRSTIAGPGRAARAGFSLAAVRGAFGERNAALLIGAPDTRRRGRGRPGAAFLVPNPAGARRLRVGDSDVVTILGARDGDRAGAAVAAVPDVDQDERPELLIGAPSTDVDGRPGAGAAYVVFSRGMRLGRTVDLADRDAALRIDGPIAGAGAGSAVTGSSDTGGDGGGDAVIGAPKIGGGSGAAYVIQLRPGPPVDLAAVDAPVVALFGTDGERAGTAVAAPGDINGDGRHDVAIGAPRARVEGRRRAGAVYLVTPAVERTVSLAAVRARMEGEAPGDRAGSELAAAGRALGGNAPDLLVGARRAEPLARRFAGATYLVSGPAVADGVDLGLLGRRGVRLAGARGAAAGAALAGDVDVDGDDRDDVLVGAPANGPGRATPSVVLRAAPPLPHRAGSESKCDAAPVSMVLDTSRGLFDADPKELRGSALKLLLAQPSSDERVTGAVRAEPMPTGFVPLVPGNLRSAKDATVLKRLADESVGTETPPGDLRAALDAAGGLLPRRSTRSAIVIAGPDAMSTPGPPPLRTDVIGLGVTRGSPQEIMLRARAASSRGGYRRATVNQLQARVAEFDALRRCETLVKERVKEIDGRRITQPSRISTLETALQSDNEFEASATIDEGSDYADLVLSWTSPGVTVEPYEVTLTDITPDTESTGLTTTFTPANVEQAVGGMDVRTNAISLTGGDSATSVALRVGLQHDDEAGIATAAYHHRWRFRVSGGIESRHSAVAAQSGPLYIQFFEPEPESP